MSVARLLLLGIGLLISSRTFAGDIQIKFKNCSRIRQVYLLSATEQAMEKVIILREELEHRLQSQSLSTDVIEKLYDADRTLACVSRHLPDLRYKCKNRDSATTAAKTIRNVGKTVWLYDNVFNYYLSAVLIHEASHKCGTNDRQYYDRFYNRPNKDAENHWEKTASIYDYWASRGFCIPGVDC